MEKFDGKEKEIWQRRRRNLMEREKREERKYCVEKEKEKIFWWRRRSNLGDGGNRFGVKGEAIL